MKVKSPRSRNSDSRWVLADPELISSPAPPTTEEFAPFAPYRPLGISRVSLGMASTMDDVRAFIAFVKKFFVQAGVPKALLSPKSSAQEASGPRLRTAALTELMLCRTLLRFCPMRPLFSLTFRSSLPQIRSNHARLNTSPEATRGR